VPDPTPSSVERLRQRLNLMVLVLPGQWLPLNVVYWLRFLPPLRPVHVTVPEHAGAVFTAAILLACVPFGLPRGWFRTRPFERGAFYRALGLRWFRWLATDGDLVLWLVRRREPRYRIVRDLRTRAQHLAGGITNERWHSSWFLFGLVTQTLAFATGEYRWGAALAALNVVFNLLPVLHQRYKRARLRGSLDAALTAASAPAAPSARRASAPGTPRTPS
jgi:hypothetical protein